MIAPGWILKACGIAAAFAVGLGGTLLLPLGAGAADDVNLPTLAQKDVWLSRSTADFPEDPSLLSSFRANLPVPSSIDPNLEPIRDFSEASSYRDIGKSVGRIDLLLKRGEDDYVINPCTATLIDERHVLTAFHCTELEDTQAQDATMAPADIVRARFVTGYLSSDGGAVYHDLAISPIEGDATYDFAIFELTEPDTQLARAALSHAAPAAGDDLLVIHHPLGRPQHLSRKNCRVIEPGGVRASAPASSTAASFLSHACGTLPGTSGAPIFDDATRTIVAIHVRGDRDVVKTAGPGNEAYGITIAQLARCDLSAPPSPILASIVCDRSPGGGG